MILDAVAGGSSPAYASRRSTSPDDDRSAAGHRVLGSATHLPIADRGHHFAAISKPGYSSGHRSFPQLAAMRRPSPERAAALHGDDNISPDPANLNLTATHGAVRTAPTSTRSRPRHRCLEQLKRRTAIFRRGSEAAFAVQRAEEILDYRVPPLASTTNAPTRLRCRKFDLGKQPTAQRRELPRLLCHHQLYGCQIGRVCRT